ncbi:MAG: SDR family oxidoreductase [Brevinema sp.]
MKKLIVITGASSGIGAATAKKFSKEGHPLLLLARRVEQMEALKLTNTLCDQVDIRDKNALYQAIKKAEEQFGDLDCLVNNAGVMLLGHPEIQEEDEWDTMIDINIKGLLYGIKYAIKSMKARQTGTIFNISSLAGRKTSKTRMAYGGTKFAVHAISEILREELASSNVRSITIAPGIVETELLSHTTDDSIKANYQKNKDIIKDLLIPEDIADMIYYAYTQPQHVCIREILVTSTKQSL